MTEVEWFKSSRSNPSGNCVEVAALGGAWVGVRDSKHPEGGHLSVRSGVLADLVCGIKAGEIRMSTVL